jgi:sulfotransferase
MFRVKPLNNEIVQRVDCEGCFDHVEVSLTNGFGRPTVMIQKYMDNFAERVKLMEIYDDDVWVVTFPKCGTTWTQELVWLINSDLDYDQARQIDLNDRFPFLE